MRDFLQLVFLVAAAATTARSDDYLDEVRGTCNRTVKSISCTKYKLLDYVDNYRVRDFDLLSDSSVRIVDIPDPELHGRFFTETRQFPGDSELTKFVKFLWRRADKFFSTQGLAVDLPDGARILEKERRGARGKKKQQQFLIPLLMLFKLFKIKVLVGLVLAGVIFIKKTILVAALVLPSIIQSVKNHCKAQQFQVVPYRVDENHYTHDHEHEGATSGFGFSGYDNTNGHKEWDRNKHKRVSFGYPYTL